MTEKTATMSDHLLSEIPAKPFNENSILTVRRSSEGVSRNAFAPLKSFWFLFAIKKGQ
jgi:hypothetical protein